MKLLPNPVVALCILALSLCGFYCGEEEEKSAQARIVSWSIPCTLTTVTYGSVSWSGLTTGNTPTEYRDIPSSSEKIAITSGVNTFNSGLFDAPEKEHRYTVEIFDKGSCASYTVSITDNGTY